MEAWSRSLARMPAGFHVDRDRLLALMRSDAILYQSPGQTILSRDGSSARWMLNTLQVTMTTRGAELAARCILELLKRFEGRQIATLGLAAVPILSSVIALSGGRYHGLLVRPQRKQHGSLKLIEGPIDFDEPTIIIDDSISSGTAMQLACNTLRDAGIRVEGGIVLVRFGWHGGFARMQEQGYQIEAVTDIWTDFIYHMEDEPKPVGNPTKIFPELQWSDNRAPEGLHPCALVRLAMQEFLETGTLLRPPDRLDADYPAKGGAWVSLRSRNDIYVRHARDGFWNFPGEAAWEAPEAVLQAAFKTAASLPTDNAIALLDDSAIAVTFFTAMEECTVGGLDNDRYGIVVRSLERPGWMGGALPRMPGILNEWDQYQHARITNGGLISFEPHVIFRHEVIKVVEPGVTWLPNGVAAPATAAPQTQAELGGLIAARARDLVIASLLGTPPRTAPLADDLLPADTEALYISVHIRGRLLGVVGGPLRRLDQDVTTLSETALGDPSAAKPAGATTPEAVSVAVSLLHGRVALGVQSVNDIIRRIRYGQQALMVEQESRSAVYLPSVAGRYNLDPVSFVEELLHKATIFEPPYRWTRFDCITWLADDRGERVVDGSFAAEAPPPGLPELLARITPLGTGYLLRHQRDDGTFFTRYEPLQDQLYEGVDLPRFAHAAWTLARAAARDTSSGEAATRAIKFLLDKAGEISAGDAAARTIQFLLDNIEETGSGVWLVHPNNEPSVAEIALLVLALCESPDKALRRRWVPPLAATLWACIDARGRVRTHADEAAGSDAFQDYFPGQVLLALAVAVRTGLTPIDELKFARAFRYYRHRFRARPRFGQVSWLTQACLAWWRIKGEPDIAELAWEIADWILRFQQDKSGAFINDHQIDTPGDTTALYLEALGAAATLARLAGKTPRYRSHLEACRRGFQFLDGLIIQARDTSVLPNPAMAIGGLRRSTRGSEVRIDFVQHYLAASIEVRDAMQL